ncbi:hypothetical protein I79_001242 [Cricetulus griseus]|uniref:Uncharacterized protein n=1 Tax=Cricetulus griseus TaxID=10029 RepID=G3GU89_CRIGR|nr:hypothetical protein I79_001242 [Cricetulus griseus]
MGVPSLWPACLAALGMLWLVFGWWFSNKGYVYPKLLLFLNISVMYLKLKSTKIRYLHR